MLETGFAELKSSYKRIAAELGDSAFDTLGVLALVEEAQSKQKHSVTVGILPEFRALLLQRFNRFVDEQVRGDVALGRSLSCRERVGAVQRSFGWFLPHCLESSWTTDEL